ncbi:MAG: hypothetical protein ACK58C_03430 [Betaproteobacteria bacterium]|jgi:hypothetical protein
MISAQVFTVTRRGITVRVTVLPTPRDVTRAFLEGSGARRMACGKVVHGFTSVRSGSAVARVTLNLSQWTPGLVAHELTHVASAYGLRDGDDDEPMAYFVHDMTDSICARMRKLEAACA